MANLASFIIPQDGEYHDAAAAGEITFTADKSYAVQILNPAYIREGGTGSGFYIFDNKPFQFTAGEDSLYIKAANGSVTVNIAD